MDNRKWFCLKKIAHSYTLDPSINDINANGGVCQTSKSHLTQVAFDSPGERLLVADSKGFVTLVELGQCLRYRRIGRVMSCTFIAFNPTNKAEMLVGSTNGDVRIIKMYGNEKDHCSLKGHEFPVADASSYKNYTLTSSIKEVIIWDLLTCTKVHQLRFTSINVNLRKAGFSSTGAVAALYRDSTLQVWDFRKLEQDVKIDPKSLGLQVVKDYEFTRDGRAMILAGIPNVILILNTFKWDLIKRLQLPDSIASVKELGVVPQPLDGGANKILAILSAKLHLHFLDLSTSRIVPLTSKEPIVGVTQTCISPNGRYIAYIDVTGSLRLEVADTLLSLGPNPKQKIEGASQSHRSHGAEEHLRCVRKYIRDELSMERLIPILKEFGEYPNKHRALIWSSILELPRNRNAYAALFNKSPQPGVMKRILAEYPLADKSKALFLATIVNCLVHWCPLLSETTFLPRFVFPFLIVFQGNHVLAFEIIIFLLSNYCQRWFEYHPLPPLNVLAMLENVLSEADPQLLTFFCEKGVTSSEYVWPLLQTLMSEVLSGDEWLILWDHIFSSGRPFLLLMSSLAYSICSRQAIMSRLKSTDDFTRFYHAQGHVRVADLLRVVRRLDRNTPYHLHPARYFKSTTCPLPKTGPYPSVLHDQYPKFLAEDSQLKLQKTYQEKEQAAIFKQQECRKLRLLEEKRVRKERDNFLREVDANRMEELRRCYQAKIRNEESSSKNIYAQRENQGCHQCYNPKEIGVNRVNKFTDREWRAENYENFKDQVLKLEFEVQALLETPHSSPTTQTTTCK